MRPFALQPIPHAGKLDALNVWLNNVALPLWQESRIATSLALR